MRRVSYAHLPREAVLAIERAQHKAAWWRRQATEARGDLAVEIAARRAIAARLEAVKSERDALLAGSSAPAAWLAIGLLLGAIACGLAVAIGKGLM